MKKKTWSVVLCIAFSLMLTTSVMADSSQPLLSKYVNWNYGKEGVHFKGYIPALKKRIGKSLETSPMGRDVYLLKRPDPDSP